MRALLLSLVLGCLVLAAVAKAPKDDPAALMARSDTQYYYPTQCGMNDLAVDLTIQELATTPVGKDAKISYYYVTEERQRFEVTNVSDQYARMRDDIASLVDPLSSYLVPRTSALAFNGLNLRVDRVSRMFLGRSDTDFFQLVGTAKDKAALVQEYRVLLDSTGLACQVESVLKDGNRLIARIENVRIGEKWCISKVTTRLVVDNLPQWRIETVEYTQVDGFTVPAKITLQNRTINNTPVKSLQDWTIVLSNYRINKGVAAAKIPTPAPATPAPAAAPAK